MREGAVPSDAGDALRKRLEERLGFVVEQAAQRAASGERLGPDPARIAAGWTQRFATDWRRAADAVALYERLGFEVCADPVRPDQLEEPCHQCWLASRLGLVMIYTRKAGAAGAGGAAG
jgi:hypothetical protein